MTLGRPWPVTLVLGVDLDFRLTGGLRVATSGLLLMNGHNHGHELFCHTPTPTGEGTKPKKQFHPCVHTYRTVPDAGSDRLTQ